MKKRLGNYQQQVVAKSALVYGHKKSTPEAKVLAYVQENGSVVRREVQKILGLGQTSAVMLLKRMVASGVLKLQGKGKNSYYVL